MYNCSIEGWTGIKTPDVNTASMTKFACFRWPMSCPRLEIPTRSCSSYRQKEKAGPGPEGVGMVFGTGHAAVCGCGCVCVVCVIVVQAKQVLIATTCCTLVTCT